MIPPLVPAANDNPVSLRLEKSLQGVLIQLDRPGRLVIILPAV